MRAHSHFLLRRRNMQTTMFSSVDLYLGAFLILCGFSLSLFNLRRVVKRNKFSSVLLSENILLTCIGMAFMARAVYQSNLENIRMYEMNERTSMNHEDYSSQCNIWSVIMSYGPLVVSFVNSFVSLVIDNYLHYTMLNDMKMKEDENTVRDLEGGPIAERKFKYRKLYEFWKRYFSHIIIGLQWILPIFFSIFMLPMGVIEKVLPMAEARGDVCMAMLNMRNETCEVLANDYTNFDLDFWTHEPSPNYLEAINSTNDEIYENKSKEINFVLKNLYGIINNIQNNSHGQVNVTSSLFRRGKSDNKCMKLCYIDNSKLLLYMFSLAVVSYFVPITISTIILTKIHMMETKKLNEKTYASRELLYNILFWTPVMLDTFLSLVMCSYSMNGMKSSLINTIANVYQAVKNFMNTKYFKDNTIIPV